MKKLRSFMFYALFTPAITLGPAALFAQEDSSTNKDVGEQDMGASAEPENQNSKLHEESTKSKYNAPESTDTTTKSDSETGDQSDIKKKDAMESPPDNGATE